MQIIREEEEKAKSLVEETREAAKRESAELMAGKENELRVRTGEARKAGEKLMAEARKEFDRRIAAAEESATVKARELKSVSRKRKDAAVDYCLKSLTGG